MSEIFDFKSKNETLKCKVFFYELLFGQSVVDRMTLSKINTSFMTGSIDEKNGTI